MLHPSAPSKCRGDDANQLHVPALTFADKITRIAHVPVPTTDRQAGTPAQTRRACAVVALRRVASLRGCVQLRLAPANLAIHSRKNSGFAPNTMGTKRHEGTPGRLRNAMDLCSCGAP